MTSPYISIVTPVYNAAPTIRRTLDALKAQTADFEHVVYDGGSSDGTVEIVKSYLGTYPMRLIQGKNEGVYGNAANGHRQTTGEIMAWINGDDFYFPWTLRIVTEVFRRYPDVEWIIGMPTWNWEGTGIVSINSYAPIYFSSFIRRGWNRSNLFGCLQQESVFWRRGIYERVGGDEVLRKYRYAGDFHLWRRFAEVAQVRTVATALGCFTIRENQFSQAFKPEYEAECGIKPGSARWTAPCNLFNRIVGQVFNRRAISPKHLAIRMLEEKRMAGANKS